MIFKQIFSKMVVLIRRRLLLVPWLWYIRISLTSKNADRWFSQNPRAWISNLASGVRLEPVPSCSAEITWTTGSIFTSLYTIIGSSAFKSLSSLWRWVTNLPRLHIIVWSTVKISPHRQLDSLVLSGVSVELPPWYALPCLSAPLLSHSSLAVVVAWQGNHLAFDGTEPRPIGPAGW